ncbi:hypothetical protein H6P81_009450 [Aristolochia fimbriata]|uniref:Transposase n=1 Tax=Aristolochia fimbriata TaxID=158543 RepID=A0AAV7EMZ1_ARIFI|nr:hypothetical protein H6P81_009450 [Aristolochia fimbriata]
MANLKKGQREEVPNEIRHGLEMTMMLNDAFMQDVDADDMDNEGLFKDALPSDNTLPGSWYEAKKMMYDLGLDYEKIHACPNNCILFRNEYKDLNNCPKCSTSRWKEKKGGVEGKHTVPIKVLRHFPLVPRLQRLFMSKKTSHFMKWHGSSRSEEGKLIHPRDSATWKYFDAQHQTFRINPRNVRLALTSDRFNPFLASGVLWEVGIKTYNADTQSFFHMCAIVLWTISDFPAYGMLSGWNTKGYKACPTCHVKTGSTFLPCSRKCVYMRHRRFLPDDHPWRIDKKGLDGKEEHDCALIPLSEEDILKQWDGYDNVYLEKLYVSLAILWIHHTLKWFFDSSCLCLLLKKIGQSSPVSVIHEYMTLESHEPVIALGTHELVVMDVPGGAKAPRERPNSYLQKLTFENGGQVPQDVVEPIVVRELEEKVRGWRAYLKDKYYDVLDKEARKECREQRVTQEQWNKLIEYWSTESNVKVAEKNKENRAYDRVRHTLGTKPLVFYYEEEKVLCPVLDEVFGRHHGGCERGLRTGWSRMKMKLVARPSEKVHRLQTELDTTNNKINTLYEEVQELRERHKEGGQNAKTLCKCSNYPGHITMGNGYLYRGVETVDRPSYGDEQPSPHKSGCGDEWPTPHKLGCGDETSLAVGTGGPVSIGPAVGTSVLMPVPRSAVTEPVGTGNQFPEPNTLTTSVTWAWCRH